MNQIDRDQISIRKALQETGGTHFEDLSLKVGENIWPALGAMLDAGEIVMRRETVKDVGERQVYRLASQLSPKEIEDYMKHVGVAGQDVNATPFIGQAFKYESELSEVPADEFFARLHELMEAEKIKEEKKDASSDDTAGTR